MRYHLYVARRNRDGTHDGWEEIAIVKAMTRDEAIIMLGGWVQLNRFYKSGSWMVKSDRQQQPLDAVRMYASEAGASC